MSKTISTLYVGALLLIGTLGASVTFASEVTGTLSSGTENSDTSEGSIDGTVSGGQTSSNGGGGGGGGGGSRTGDRNNNNNNNSNNDDPDGAVLGASFAQADTPTSLGFPNAGELSSENQFAGLLFLLVLATGIGSVLYLKNARTKRLPG